MVLVLTAGQRHEQSAFEALMEQGAVNRPGRARSKLRPKRVVADKGYNSGKIRGYLRRRGIGMSSLVRVINGDAIRSTSSDTDNGIG